MYIQIIGTSNRGYAHITLNSSLEKSEVIRAVIVRTCKELKRDNEGNPKGTRIFGAIAWELK
uniref:Uncharacterized protein n=1 Tax=Manihot esculenta TaxID=3983 RepID=A0A2C9W797_MANES